MKIPKEKAKDDDQPAMPFNEALKRVWSSPPMPKVKAAAKKQDKKSPPERAPASRPK